MIRDGVLLFLLAVAARVGFIVVWGGANAPLRFPDAQAYWQLAESLAAGNGLVDERGFRAARMPAYPALLSLFVGMKNGLAAVRITQAMIGALAAVIIAQLGTNLVGRPAGLLAGLAVAVDPFFIFFSNLLLTETLFITALTATWLVASRLVVTKAPTSTDRNESAKSEPRNESNIPRWLAVGVLFALCAYVRPSSAGLLPAFIVVAIARGWRQPSVWWGSVMMIFVVILALLPWALRNERLTGERVWLTNRFGISLWDGLAPRADGSSNLAGTEDLPAIQGLPEGEWNRYFRREAINAARQDPARVIALAWTKINRTWNIFPNVQTHQSRAIRAVSAGWMIPFYLFFVVGLWTLRRSPWTIGLLLLPAVYFSILHAIFVGSMRYRLPTMPLLEIIAAAGLVSLLARFWRPRRLSTETEPAVQSGQSHPNN